MNRQPAQGASSRSAAVGELFAALAELMISYQALPDAERDARWGADAELITAAVALHLNTARGRIAAGSRPVPAPEPVAPPTAVPEISEQADPTGVRRPA